MGNNDERIDVQVGAQVGDLKTGMDQATAKVAQATANMQEQFQGKFAAISASTQQMATEVKTGLSSIEATVAKVTGAFGILMGILAGGSILKGAVDEFVTLNLEAKKLSNTMGSSVQDAAALIAAYGRIGVSNDTVSQTMRLLERNIHSNADAIVDMGKQVGVNIDLNADLKTIYFQIIDALGQYEVGHERNKASIAAFGARVQNVNALLRVHKEDVEAAAEHLAKLGLTMDDISVAKARAFQAGMHDVHLEMDAIKYKIGEVAIPALTSLGRAFIWVTDRIKEMITAEGSAEAGIAALGGYGPAPDRGLTYPPAQEKKEKSGKNYVAPPKGAGAGGGGTGADKSRLQAWTDELNQMKVAENAFLDYSKEQERQFWQEKLQECEKGSQEYLQVQQRIYTLSKEIAKQGVQEELAALSLKQSSEKTNMTQRLALEDQKLALLAAKYGQDSQNYRQELQRKQQLLNQAEKEANQLEQQKLDNQLKLAQMDIELERQRLAFKQEMGVISASEEMTQLVKLKNQEIQLETDHFEKLKVIWAKYPAEMQKIQSQMLIATQKNAADKEKAEEQAALAMKNKYVAVMAPLNQAVSTSVQGMIQGTQKFSQGHFCPVN